MTKSLSTRIAAFATSLLTTALLASNAEPLTGSGDSRGRATPCH